ncbi:uracil-DNA glycosylase [Capnocytophaga sp. oral taxon 863 str. F0517]|uniref:uracil-DNA glycosylase n=1 Tax=Capnocytophaga sp. oral taxon 863 TaxID=1227265 RepID=UPI000396534E|nr:uracil-DNA glycosylase [Capnocytophaga sp. oral taxon 863]ERI61993.1 uracil-DNA glycosylase [Capnocytophaga sp. oral taxon 863 str. F0517]
MIVRIDPSWNSLLHHEFEKPYFESLTDFVKKEYSEHTCYPKGKEIFAAFDQCPVAQLKVVLLGQDPYHGEGQANGLSFSVREGVAHPPSLVNIFKEIQEDLQLPYPESGDLSRWARQGVLLLNATLTVRANKAGSHQGQGWETFTDAVIKAISDHGEHIVFLLWGGFAKKKIELIDTQKHCVLTSGHPSPLSANRGYWFGNRHFSKTNEYLTSIGRENIDWR